MSPTDQEKALWFPNIEDALGLNLRLPTTHLPALTMDGNMKRHPNLSSFCKESLNGRVVWLSHLHGTLKSGLGVRRTAFALRAEVRAGNGGGPRDRGGFLRPASPGIPMPSPRRRARPEPHATRVARPIHDFLSSDTDVPLGDHLCSPPEPFAIVEVKFRFCTAIQPSQDVFPK